MNLVVVMLFAFVALGLANRRLGKAITAASFVAILVAYVAYAYIKG